MIMKLEILKMKPNLTWVVIALLIVAGAVGYFLREDPSMVEYKKVSRHILSTHSPNGQSAANPGACGSPDCKDVVAAVGNEKGVVKTESHEELDSLFQADERGNLVLNENTRINIEKLYALNTPEELADKMQKLSQVLPDAAHRQVTHLVDYFDKYTRDVKEIYSPDIEPETVDDILTQLRVTHDLRLAHFGADVARAFYDHEEKMSLQLIYLMLNEKDENLPLAEKVQRAQDLLLSNPELAAAYDPDRK